MQLCIRLSTILQCFTLASTVYIHDNFIASLYTKYHVHIIIYNIGIYNIFSSSMVQSYTSCESLPHVFVYKIYRGNWGKCTTENIIKFAPFCQATYAENTQRQTTQCTPLLVVRFSTGCTPDAISILELLLGLKSTSLPIKHFSKILKINCQKSRFSLAEYFLFIRIINVICQRNAHTFAKTFLNRILNSYNWILFRKYFNGTCFIVTLKLRIKIQTKYKFKSML